MKKIVSIILAVATLASCNKGGQEYDFIGSQWISEVMPSDGFYQEELPEGALLLDVEAKSKAGKATWAWIVDQGDSYYEADDIVELSTAAYTFNAASGEFTSDLINGIVSFISENQVKIATDKTVLILSRVEKPYSLSDLREPNQKFTAVAEKTSDWAGGEIIITANKPVKYCTYSDETDYIPDGNGTANTSEPTKVKVTLGLYKDNDGNIQDAEVIYNLESFEGEKISVRITSKGWRPVFYDNDVPANEISGSELEDLPSIVKIGILDKAGEEVPLTSDDTGWSWSGITFELPEMFTSAGGNDGELLVYDVQRGTGSVEFVYGEQTYTYEVGTR